LPTELFLKQGEPLAITENVSEVIEVLRDPQTSRSNTQIRQRMHDMHCMRVGFC